MNTFSLLQLSLGQTIDRHAFEDASSAVPSVSRVDCAMLHRELYGIVVSNLPEDDALAFQAELKERNFPTVVVPDYELPMLHESFRVQFIERREDDLVLADSIGHERIRPVTDLVFLAAGLVGRLHFKSDWHQYLDSGIDGDIMPKLVFEREFHEQTELEFRLDFFFNNAPERQHASIGLDTMIFHQGDQLRLSDTAGLNELTSAMAELLPPERVNTYLRNPDSHLAYPTFHCYEEEIRWCRHALGVRELIPAS